VAMSWPTRLTPTPRMSAASCHVTSSPGSGMPER
jgi:hypothetical protein